MTAAEERGLKIQPNMEIDALPMAVAILARLPVCTVLAAIGGRIAKSPAAILSRIRSSIRRYPGACS